MDTTIRPYLLSTIVLLAGLGGCASVREVASVVTHPFTPAPSTAPAPVPAGLDDYKAQVAHRVLERNPEHRYDGTLPPLLPAIVVLEITVDRQGRMTNIVVQRSRSAAASDVALASMRRSAPLPPPQDLARGGKLTFSETFLFADSERYQLRSLRPAQAGE